MNRRDFLKLSPFALAPLLGADARRQPFDLAAAFANVKDGDVINIPPGDYFTDGLTLRNKRDVTINANHAKIHSNSINGAPMLDMAGTAGCSLYGLRLDSRVAPVLPVAGLVLGRTEQSAGGSNSFYDCTVGGNFTGASIYSVCQECNSFIGGGATTETDKPALIISSRDFLGLGLVESSNCLMWISNFTLLNYGTALNLVICRDSVSGLSIKDSYCYLGNGGTFLQADGISDRTYYLTLSNIRAEGNGNCLLADISGVYVATWDIERIMWQISSPYIVHSDSAIIDSRLDFRFCGWAYADKWLHLTNGAWLDRVDLVGAWDGKIVRE